MVYQFPIIWIPHTVSYPFLCLYLSDLQVFQLNAGIVYDWCTHYFSALKGHIVTLDEGGKLYVSYLGTDPSLQTAQPTEKREINYEV